MPPSINDNTISIYEVGKLSAEISNLASVFKELSQTVKENARQIDEKFERINQQLREIVDTHTSRREFDDLKVEVNKLRIEIATVKQTTHDNAVENASNRFIIKIMGIVISSATLLYFGLQAVH